MDQDPIPMPDFAGDEAFMLREGIMATFGWNEERTIQHLEATWRQAHPEPGLPPVPPPQQERQEEQEPDQPREAEEPGDPVKQAQERRS